MNMSDLFDRAALRRLANRLNTEALARLGIFRPMYPPLALEVGADTLTLVHVERERKQPPRVRRYATFSVAEGAMDVRFGRDNLRRPADVASAVQEILARESIDATGISLVLPDHLARVSLLHMAERPAGRAETLELIRWKLKKTVPFRVDDAHVDYQAYPTPGDDSSVTYLTTMVLQSVLAQYESLFAQLELHAGLIDLSTFALVNLDREGLAADDGDVFVLNVTGSFFALMILRGGVPIFYRAKTYAHANGAGRAGLPAMIARHVESSLAYYRERLAGAENARIRLRCVDLDADEVAAELIDRLEAEVAHVDPTRVIAIDPRSQDEATQRVMLQRIAPALGAALGRDS